MRRSQPFGSRVNYAKQLTALLVQLALTYRKNLLRPFVAPVVLTTKALTALSSMPPVWGAYIRKLNLPTARQTMVPSCQYCTFMPEGNAFHAMDNPPASPNAPFVLIDRVSYPHVSCRKPLGASQQAR